MLPDFDLAAYAASCHVKDVDLFTGKCLILHEFLVEYNTHVNLTRLTSPVDFCFKHVCDSLSIAKIFPEIAGGSFTIADIGCGAGFPSLILAAAFPQLEITAIDSIGKKVNFVRQAAEKLELTNLNAIQGRAVELNRKAEFQSKFDIVTARAVAPSPKLYRETDKFPVKTGAWIFYKTPGQAAEELPELQKMKNIHWEVSPEYPLPGDAGTRLFVKGIRK